MYTYETFNSIQYITNTYKEITCLDGVSVNCDLHVSELRGVDIAEELHCSSCGQMVITICMLLQSVKYNIYNSLYIKNNIFLCLKRRFSQYFANYSFVIYKTIVYFSSSVIPF